MLKFDTVQEMRTALPAGMCDDLAELCAEYVDAAEDPEQASLTELLGGAVYLVERVEDLSAVRSHEVGSDGRLSLLDGPTKWFDIAEWSACCEFARFVAIDTPLGGAQYVVPRSVAEGCAAVQESVRKVHQRGHGP